MKTIAAAILVAVMFVAFTLAGIALLIAAAIRTASITNPVWTLLIKGTEVVVGTFWLLGAVYVATHLMVLAFRPKTPRRI